MQVTFWRVFGFKYWIRSYSKEVCASCNYWRYDTYLSFYSAPWQKCVVTLIESKIFCFTETFLAFFGRPVQIWPVCILSFQSNSTAISANLAAMFCPTQLCPLTAEIYLDYVLQKSPIESRKVKVNESTAKLAALSQF